MRDGSNCSAAEAVGGCVPAWLRVEGEAPERRAEEGR